MSQKVIKDTFFQKNNQLRFINFEARAKSREFANIIYTLIRCLLGFMFKVLTSIDFSKKKRSSP